MRSGTSKALLESKKEGKGISENCWKRRVLPIGVQGQPCGGVRGQHTSLPSGRAQRRERSEKARSSLANPPCSMKKKRSVAAQRPLACLKIFAFNSALRGRGPQPKKKTSLVRLPPLTHERWFENIKLDYSPRSN